MYLSVLPRKDEHIAGRQKKKTYQKFYLLVFIAKELSQEVGIPLSSSVSSLTLEASSS